MWTLRRKGMRETRVAAPSGGPAARRRTFIAEFRVRSDGTAGAVSFSEEGSGPVTFGGPAPTPVPWTSWTLLRATARGAGAADASVSAERLPDGTKLIFR